MDEAASHVRIRKSATPLSMQESLRGLESLRKEKDQAIGAQQYEFAAEFRDRELKLRAHREDGRRGSVRNRGAVAGATATGEATSCQCRRDCRSRRYVDGHPRDPHGCRGDGTAGQDGGAHPPASSGRMRPSLRLQGGPQGARWVERPKRPIGSFLFLGPTGVGKT